MARFLAWFQDINRRLFSCRNSSKGRQHPSSNMHCVTLVYSPFFFLSMHHLKSKSQLSAPRIAVNVMFFIHSWINTPRPRLYTRLDEWILMNSIYWVVFAPFCFCYVFLPFFFILHFLFLWIKRNVFYNSATSLN